MKLAGAAWSFVGATLAESAAVWRALGIGAMDLIAAPGMGMDPAAIDRDPRGQAQLAAAPGLELSNLLYMFGEDFQDRAINSADPEVRARNTDTLRNVLDCCVAARIPSLLVLPGVDQPGMSHQESLDLSARVLTEMSAAAADAGVLLVFEPHVDSHLEDPAETLRVSAAESPPQDRSRLRPLHRPGLQGRRRRSPAALRRTLPPAPGRRQAVAGALGRRRDRLCRGGRQAQGGRLPRAT